RQTGAVAEVERSGDDRARGGRGAAPTTSRAPPHSAVAYPRRSRAGGSGYGPDRAGHRELSDQRAQILWGPSAGHRLGGDRGALGAGGGTRRGTGPAARGARARVGSVPSRQRDRGPKRLRGGAGAGAAH